MPNFSILQTARVAAEPPTAQDELLTPTDYEQYLPLSKPMDVAVSGDYTAIADGNVIYIYNRFEGVYRKYTHVINTNPNTSAMNVVTELQFSDAGDLYYIDGIPNLHVLKREQLASLSETTVATNTNLTCSSFTIEKDMLYYTHISGTVANLSSVPLSNLTPSSAISLAEGISNKPIVTYYDDAIYYTDYSIRLRRIDLTNPTPTVEAVCTFPVAVDSLVISRGDLFMTNTDGNFYVYNLSRLEYEKDAEYVAPIESDERGGYRALSLQGNNVYAIRNESIREYRIADGFTSYEISANSDAPHRLNGATDSLLVGGKFYVADTGNRRISVREEKTGAYTVYPTSGAPTLVASDGKTFAGANESFVWLFDLENNETAAPILFDNFNGKIVGVECVYGNYHVVTDTNYYYVISYLPLPNSDESVEKAEEYAWQMTGGKEKTTKLVPYLLSSDAYGNLYVAAKTGDLYKLTEKEFSTPDDVGIKISNPTLEISLQTADSFLVDLNENVYILKDNRLVCYAYDANEKVCASAPNAYNLGKSLVYGQTEATLATSAAFDIVGSKVYLIYAGNLAISTQTIPIPTADTIATQSIETEIFSASEAEFTVVETTPNALLIAFDLQALSTQTASGASVFPYLSHHREPQAQTALKLGSAGEYAVLAVFDKQAHTYTNYLTKSSYYVTEKSQDEYLVDYAPEDEKTGYLTNAVTLYKYPYLTKLLQVTGLKKNQAVTLIGEVNDLDYSYYQIAYQDETGATQVGFIPKTYVTLFNGEPLPSTEHVYAEQAPNEDELWRLTFLLLGAAAICILTDLLIFRRQHKND